ncbi:UNVERIFIED_CONTAM: putative membrane protein [Streptomyces canus]
MRMFQRAAVVAVAIAGLSTLGAGVGFAGDNGEAPPPISAVANSSANAVAFGGGDYYTLPAQPEGQPEAQPEAQPEEQQPEAQPEAQQPEAQPEEQHEEQHGEE